MPASQLYGHERVLTLVRLRDVHGVAALDLDPLSARDLQCGTP